MLHSSTQLPPVTAKHQLVKILRDKSEQTRMYNSLISTSAHQPVPLTLPYMNYLCAGVKQQCAKPPPPHQLGVWGSTVTSSRQRGLGKPWPSTVFLYFKCTGWYLMLHSRGFLAHHQPPCTSVFCIVYCAPCEMVVVLDCLHSY